jgi:hypothetical protein
VRIEIEIALRTERIRVIPVLVRNASMPRPDQLPESIRRLVNRSGMNIRPNPDFQVDVSRLSKNLREIIDEIVQFNRSKVGSVLSNTKSTEESTQVTGDPRNAGGRPPQKGTVAAEADHSTAQQRIRISGLAIASLVCSLIFIYGSVPAIICGHLARRHIRQNSTLLGNGVALAGLITGYIGLALLVIVIAMASISRSQ